MRHREYILPAVAAAALFSSCEHKPLWMPEAPMGQMEVRYDWSHAPSAAPEGMTLLLYDTGGGAPWLYNLPPDGGNIETEDGRYMAISYNNDTSGILFRNNDNYTQFEAYTRRGNLLDGLGTPYSGPLPQRDEDETVVITPDPMWLCNPEEPVTAPAESLTLFPRLITARYRFTVDRITNLDGAVQMCASMSGLAGGIMLGSGERTAAPVTLPSQAAVSGSSNVSGEFLTFGLPQHPVVPNILTLYIWLSDGLKYSYNFDVTEQVRGAADPLDVTVTAGGIELPEVGPTPDLPGSGGIGVDVDTWHVVDIELKPVE